MIKAVFLDFYGTMAHWAPAAEAIQASACEAEGLRVNEEALAGGYPAADAYMSAEQARSPVLSRPEAERQAFFAEYERRLLAAAGVEVPLETARRIWERIDSTPKELELYDDARPTLEELVGAGLKTGCISNMGSSLHTLMERLGLRQLLHVSATSSEAGVSKPHAAIFQMALAKANVAPHEAIHVGDDYRGDVGGAQNAKMHALLLARKELGVAPGDCPVIKTLREVLPYVLSHQHVAFPPAPGPVPGGSQGE